MSASDDRYNHSEKGRARYRRYWHKPNGGLHRRRERLNAKDQARIDELLALLVLDAAKGRSYNFSCPHKCSPRR